MRCVEPYVSGKGAFGCGKCLPCRRAKQREWTHRLMLEGLCHADKSFVTLTYSEEKCPDELRPDHLRDFLKRLRWRVRPAKLRYYGVGEYGSRSGRPHYHLALYGFPACGYAGHSRLMKGDCPCLNCTIVRETWGFGFVSVGRLEVRSAAYIAKYVLKKMTKRSDYRLNGRYPEFSRMSLGSRGEGGIGAPALWDVASVLLKYDERTLIGKDVPMVLNHSKNLVLPLGRYLRKKLRLYCGKSEKAPESSLQTLANQMQIVRAFAWNTDRSVSSVFREINGPYEQQLLARVEMGTQRETI